MKVSSAAVMLIVVLASALATDAVPAYGRGRSGGGHSAHHSGSHHHHARTGFFAGAIVAAPVWPWWDYAPRAYAAAPVYYIEQSDQAEGEWLYCSASSAYFPHVAQCASGWQRVPAQTVPAQP